MSEQKRGQRREGRQDGQGGFKPRPDRKDEKRRMGARLLAPGAGVNLILDLESPFAVGERQVTFTTGHAQIPEQVRYAKYHVADNWPDGVVTVPPQGLIVFDERTEVIELIQSVVEAQIAARSIIQDLEKQEGTLEEARETMIGLKASTKSIDTQLAGIRQSLEEARQATAMALKEEAEVDGQRTGHSRQELLLEQIRQPAEVFVEEPSGRRTNNVVLAPCRFDRANRFLSAVVVDLAPGLSEGINVRNHRPSVSTSTGLSQIDSGQQSPMYLRGVGLPRSSQVLYWGVHGPVGDNLTFRQEFVVTLGQFAESFDIRVEGSDEIRFRVTPKTPAGIEAQPAFGTIQAETETESTKVEARGSQAAAQTAAGGNGLGQLEAMVVASGRVTDDGAEAEAVEAEGDGTAADTAQVIDGSPNGHDEVKDKRRQRLAQKAQHGGRSDEADEAGVG